MLNVAGHRIGTMEVESALVDHPRVAEAAVVGRPHEIKGQAVAAFVTLKEGTQGVEALVAELKEHVVKKIGAIARPDDMIFAADLPKTRSGKIMRRLLRDIAEGKALGDTTTLADPAVVARLKSSIRTSTGRSSVGPARHVSPDEPSADEPERRHWQGLVHGSLETMALIETARPLENLRDGLRGDPRAARRLDRRSSAASTWRSWGRRGRASRR